jgi:FkbM family methyltransferase
MTPLRTATRLPRRLMRRLRRVVAPLGRAVSWCHRVHYFRQVMGSWCAIKLAFCENRRGDIAIHLREIGRNVVLRGSTTDIKCFEKIFLAKEYQSPFDLSPGLIIDAGANTGMATLYFAARYPNATIVAIEPESSNFQTLQRNCIGLKNVILMQAALWPEDRSLKLNDPNSEAWTFSVSEQGSGTTPATEVSAVTVEGILRQLGARQIDLLKLDIEGAELELFSRGAAKWIDQVRFIVIELHDRYRPGCTRSFYSQLVSRDFVQEIRGENIFVKIAHD